MANWTSARPVAQLAPAARMGRPTPRPPLPYPLTCPNPSPIPFPPRRLSLPRSGSGGGRSPRPSLLAPPLPELVRARRPNPVADPVVLTPDVLPAASDCAGSTASAVFVDYVDASELGTPASRGSSRSLPRIAVAGTSSSSSSPTRITEPRRPYPCIVW